MKPGVSEATTGVFFHELTSFTELASTPGSVASHGTTSTSGNTGAGLKKWMPITRSECALAEAIAPIESEDVFVASVASDAITAPSLANSARLTPSSSTIASMTTPQSANMERSFVTGASTKRMRSMVASRAPAASFPFSTSFASILVRLARALVTAPALASASTTSWPAAAATWAMPLPIAPAPTTPMRDSPVVLVMSDYSTTVELWLALRQKGAHALGVVGGAPSLPLQLLLVVELGVEVDT